CGVWRTSINPDREAKGKPVSIRFLRRELGSFAKAIAVGSLLVLLATPQARAFGDAGAFDPRILLTGSQTGAARPTAPGRWAWELVERTSAPARLHPSVVRADDPAIVNDPFLYW